MCIVDMVGLASAAYMGLASHSNFCWALQNRVISAPVPGWCCTTHSHGPMLSALRSSGPWPRVRMKSAVCLLRQHGAGATPPTCLQTVARPAPSTYMYIAQRVFDSWQIVSPQQRSVMEHPCLCWGGLTPIARETAVHGNIGWSVSSSAR